MVIIPMIRMNNHFKRKCSFALFRKIVNIKIFYFFLFQCVYLELTTSSVQWSKLIDTFKMAIV